MAGRKIALIAALMVSAGLTACDNGPSAVAQKPAADMQVAETPARTTERATAPAQVDRRQDPVPEIDGKPLWTASRRFSAEDNVQRAFERNGEAFGARDVESFARKAHAFVGHPPKGVQTITRPNGDTLFYDPKGNVFAVADKAGTPRTMFKPDAGAAYWEQQKASVAQRRAARSQRAQEEAG